MAKATEGGWSGSLPSPRGGSRKTDPGALFSSPQQAVAGREDGVGGHGWWVRVCVFGRTGDTVVPAEWLEAWVGWRWVRISLSTALLPARSVLERAGRGVWKMGEVMT